LRPGGAVYKTLGTKINVKQGLPKVCRFAVLPGRIAGDGKALLKAYPPRNRPMRRNPFWVDPKPGLRFTPSEWLPVVTKSVFTAKYDRFRKRLVSARKVRALTQREVAERLDRPQSFVSKYERGERRLDVVEFLEVAKAIDTDPFKLLRELDS
jgi:DNA-binding transcriptional regulator YiaG